MVLLSCIYITCQNSPEVLVLLLVLELAVAAVVVA